MRGSSCLLRGSVVLLAGKWKAADVTVLLDRMEIRTPEQSAREEMFHEPHDHVIRIRARGRRFPRVTPARETTSRRRSPWRRARRHEEPRADRRRPRRARSRGAQDDVGALGALQHPAGHQWLAGGRRSRRCRAGTREGVNDWGAPATAARVRRSAATATSTSCTRSTRCCPSSSHPSKARLETAMQGHVLAHAVLIGTYQKRH